MTCNELTDFLLDYLSGELSEEVRTTFESHLSACRDCRNYLDSYRKTIAVARAVKTVNAEPMPDALAAAILKARKTQPAG